MMIGNYLIDLHFSGGNLISYFFVLADYVDINVILASLWDDKRAGVELDHCLSTYIDFESKNNSLVFIENYC